MKTRANTITTLALAGLIAGGLSISLSSQAQESAAGQEMDESAASVRSAGSDAADSAKHAYYAAKDEVDDAALTIEVKTALLTDEVTRKDSIHVDSDHGAVTLDGTVDSPATAAHAQAIVANVHGVETIRNHLTVPMGVR